MGHLALVYFLYMMHLNNNNNIIYMAISSHLAAWLQANEMLEFGCYEYYWQEIVAIVFIVLGKMAVTNDLLFPTCHTFVALH